MHRRGVHDWDLSDLESVIPVITCNEAGLGFGWAVQLKKIIPDDFSRAGGLGEVRSYSFWHPRKCVDNIL